MNDTHEQALPTKCKQCNRAMSTPVVCDYCHTLDPAGVGADHFSLLGLPRQFELDGEQLQRKFLALSRHAHPDFHMEDSDEVQGLHLHVSAAVNDAYRTLKNSATRAAYLLELLGGKSSAKDKSVPDGFLGTMMMMQEELADAKDADDSQELLRLGEVLATQHEGLMNRIEILFEQYQQSLVCEAVRTDLLGELRKQLNAVSYVRKLRSQLS